MEVDLKLSLKHCFRVPRIVGNDNINGFIILNSEQNTFLKKNSELKIMNSSGSEAM
jgi:hypothetical protein